MHGKREEAGRSAVKVPVKEEGTCWALERRIESSEGLGNSSKPAGGILPLCERKGWMERVPMPTRRFKGGNRQTGG